MCEAYPSKDMNIVEIIMEQHCEFRSLMEQVCDSTAADLEERKRLLHLTRSGLNSHWRAEERVLFPMMERDARTRQAALEAWEWHAASNYLIKPLTHLSPADELWMPKWLVVGEVLLTHLDAEEARALAPLEEVFEQDELEQMGRDFLAEATAGAERKEG